MFVEQFFDAAADNMVNMFDLVAEQSLTTPWIAGSVYVSEVRSVYDPHSKELVRQAVVRFDILNGHDDSVHVVQDVPECIRPQTHVDIIASELNGYISSIFFKDSSAYLIAIDSGLNHEVARLKKSPYRAMFGSNPVTRSGHEAFYLFLRQTDPRANKR